MISRLHHFLQDWIESLSNYRGAYLIAGYSATIWILFIYYEPASSALSEILLSCGFVFPLMISIWLIRQITWKTTLWKWIWWLMALIIGIGFYSYIHSLGVFNEDYSGMEQHHIFIILSYIVARWSMLWWITYSTYKVSLQTRWWLKELVMNIIIAVISSLILRWWLSASIGSVSYLFDIDIYYKWYQYIGVISFCIVGFSILLTNLTTTKQVNDYSKIFRFFWLYIFLPLAVIYAMILIVYGAKIIITQTWPKGLISWMVMWYTIRCTVVYFLTYPLQTLSAIKKIHTWYFVSILLFLPLFVGAIRQRITEYGITEQRYLLIMIAIWVAITGIGSLIWRSKSWLIIIGSGLILCISSTYTPRSATKISLLSQTARLEQLLTDAKLRDGTQITPHLINSDTFSTGDNIWYDIGQAANIISYLARSHGINSLQKFYTGTGFETLSQENKRDIEKIFLKNRWVTGYIIDNNAGYTTTFDDDQISFNIYASKENIQQSIPIDGYTRLQFINSQSTTDHKLNLAAYGEQLYQLSIHHTEVPVIKTDTALIIVESLNGVKHQKTNTYNIDYYSILLLTK